MYLSKYQLVNMARRSTAYVKAYYVSEVEAAVAMVTQCPHVDTLDTD